MTFKEWFRRLKREAAYIDWPINEDDPDSYKEAYEDGLSPSDMLQEEIDATRNS
jgi:hypothetical protein